MTSRPVGQEGHCFLVICTIITIMRAVIEKEIALIMHETSLLMHKYTIVRQLI